MQVNLAQGPAQAMASIAAAVTPVVMISANAILIGAISSKHQAMSDRLRTLTAEWRSLGEQTARRDSIQAQVRVFTLRIAWISRAHFLLYVATACFISMVPVIAVAPVLGWPALASLSLTLLLAGAVLMLVAIFFELLDLAQARATIEADSRDLTK